MEITAVVSVIGLISSMITIGEEILKQTGLRNSDDPTMQSINQKFGKITNSLNKLSDQNSNEFREWIKQIHDQYNKKIPDLIDDTLNTIDRKIKKIDHYYDKMMLLLKKGKTRRNAIKLSKNILSLNDDAPSEILDSLASLFEVTRLDFANRDLLKIVDTFKSRDNFLCDHTQTAQYALLTIYRRLLLTEAKAFQLITFGYIIRYQNDYDATYYAELEIHREENSIRMNRYKELFYMAMSDTPRSIHRCDPPKGHTYGDTYGEFTELTYAFVSDQKSFGIKEPFIGSKCAFSCQSIRINNEYQRVNSICQGRIFDCQGDTSYEICTPTLEMVKSHRKYNWIKDTENSKQFGKHEDGCNNGVLDHGNSFKDFPWRKKCNWCLCMCEKSEPSHDNTTVRALSYIWSETNVKDNMVAIGARIVPIDRMFHIQLYEGKLTPAGGILPGSERWVPLPKFIYDGFFPSKIKFSNGTVRNLIKNVDYGMVSLKKNQINLDDLIVDDGTILIGARFNNYSLDLSSVPFDWLAGIILQPSLKRRYSSMDNGLRTELSVNEPDNPTVCTTNLPIIRPNTFVKVRASDLKKDAAQSVIPYFDLQEVITKPSIPLSGIGLIYRANLIDECGGFISLRIFTINFAVYLDDVFPFIINFNRFH